MKQKIITWIGILILLSFSVNAVCSIDTMINDTVNKYSVLNCSGTNFVLQNTPDYSVGIIVLLPLILGFLLMYWATNLGDDHNVLRILIYLSPIPLFFMSYKYAVIVLDKFYILDTLIGSMSDDIYIIGLIFFVIIAYFILYLIVKTINYIGQKQEEKLQY